MQMNGEFVVQPSAKQKCCTKRMETVFDNNTNNNQKNETLKNMIPLKFWPKQTHTLTSYIDNCIAQLACDFIYRYDHDGNAITAFNVNLKRKWPFETAAI